MPTQMTVKSSSFCFMSDGHTSSQVPELCLEEMCQGTL